MKEYKKKIDEIHAPEALIATTLNRIHEEKKIIRPRRWAAGLTAVAAAAAVVLVIGLGRGNGASLNLVYNTVPETLVRSNIDSVHPGGTMEVEEYGAYIGLNIAKPTSNATVVKAEINVTEAVGVIIEDEATIVYNVDGEQMMVQYSGTKDIIPDSLKVGEVSQVEGHSVWVAVSENGKEYMASLHMEKATCFLLSYSMDRQEFEAFLSDFVKGIENK